MNTCSGCGSNHVIETKRNVVCRFCGMVTPKTFRDPSGARVANAIAPITRHDRVIEAMRNAGERKR